MQLSDWPPAWLGPPPALGPQSWNSGRSPPSPQLHFVLPAARREPAWWCGSDGGGAKSSCRRRGPGPPSTFPKPPFFTRPVCPCGPVNAGRSCRRPPHAVYSLAQLNGSLSSGSAPFTTSDRKHCEGGARGTMQDLPFFRCLFMTALHFCSLLFLCSSLQAEASANQTTPTRLLHPNPTPRKLHALLTPPSPPIQLLSDPT